MIVKNIKDLCQKHKVTVFWLENQLGFGNGTIAKWATSSPTVERLKKVADYFGVTVDDLMREE